MPCGHFLAQAPQETQESARLASGTNVKYWTSNLSEFSNRQQSLKRPNIFGMSTPFGQSPTQYPHAVQGMGFLARIAAAAAASASASRLGRVEPSGNAPGAPA
jgi:hypothetical protein